SFSSWASSASTPRSSSRDRSRVSRSSSDCSSESREVTRCAFAWSSQRSGRATSVSSSATSARLASGSTTASIESSALLSSASSAGKSETATTDHSNRTPKPDRLCSAPDTVRLCRSDREDRMTEQVLAIDVGGTKIAAALVDRDGRIGRETVRPTPRSADPDEVFGALADAVTELVEPAGGSRLRVGIGSAGPIDEPAGTVSPVNIGAWRDFPIVPRTREVIARLTGSEPLVGLAGDGHCFALGEHWLGAGRDLESIIGVVVSTGVGGGAVLRNRLVGGMTGNAVHLGHITVNAWGGRCVCGNYGCVELYARGPGMVAAAQQAGWTGEPDARALTAAARAGDPIAVSVVDRGMR